MSQKDLTDAPPYLIPEDGHGDGVKVYNLHTPFNPPSTHDDYPIAAQSSAAPVYTSGGGVKGGPSSGRGGGIGEPVTTNRFVSHESNLGDSPGMTTCASCQQQVMTNVTYKAGTYAWIMCLVFILCGLVLCCCLIPFFMKHFKDAYHSCPRCNRILHVEKKRCC